MASLKKPSFMIDQWKFEQQAPGRCINLDWLEVYCLESFELYPVDASYFRDKGFSVREREYGTRQYKEMFVVLDQYEQPFVEVRRNPVASADAKGPGIFDPLSCHLRLSNRYCYHPQSVSVFSDFLHNHRYTVKRLYRLDLCLDFTAFDSGDDPHKFMLRYLSGKYSKINQTNIASHGKDQWSSRLWNSVSWGSPTSMVSTKFYNKSLELREAKDKPYIRYAWFAAGLVDDFQTLTKLMPDGTKQEQAIYRVEFSIRSGASHWLRIEDNNGRKTKTIVQTHDLGCYRTKLQQLEAFAMLAHHYFHFKHYQPNIRKDRCPDKVLFLFNLNHTPYKLDRLMSSAPKDTNKTSLLRKLQYYRLTQPDEKIRNACDVLISALESDALRNVMPDYYDKTEAQLLQAIISVRLGQEPKEPLQTTRDKLAPYFQIQTELF